MTSWDRIQYRLFDLRLSLQSMFRAAPGRSAPAAGSGAEEVDATVIVVRGAPDGGAGFDDEATVIAGHAPAARRPSPAVAQAAPSRGSAAVVLGLGAAAVAVAALIGAGAWFGLRALHAPRRPAVAAAAAPASPAAAPAQAAAALPPDAQERAPPSNDGIPEEFHLRNLSPKAAEFFNAAIPISPASNPPAEPFVLRTNTPADAQRALLCMTTAIYYEAATEPVEGQRAVAQVVLNRMRDPSYPNSVCGVVFQGSNLPTGWQFSFTGDGSLSRARSPKLWAQAQQVADAALKGFVAANVGHATHYHTKWVVPYWSPRLEKVANVGAHVFYRWLGPRGRPNAFTDHYAGAEQIVPQLAGFDPSMRATADAPAEEPAAPAAANTTPPRPPRAGAGKANQQVDANQLF